jgi:archaellum component FlaC
MDARELNKTLVELQDELKRVKKVDKGSRESLKRLDDSIHRVLQTSWESTTTHHATLRESLEDALQYIEASHPTATGLINRLLKALSDMGV